MNNLATNIDIDCSGLERIEHVFESQQTTALALRSSTAKQRIEKLKALRAAIMARSDQLYKAGYADYRKPEAEVDAAEIMPAISEINDAIRHVKKWMKRRRVKPTQALLGTRSWVQYEPRGRCLLISPWNYPINLTFGPLAYAIAAGCTVMIKPSELSPNLSKQIGEIVAEVFDDNEVAVFEGDVDVSTQLLALPFDHIFFTGSPAVGKLVMAAAAQHLSSVTLELGGKSPVIVDKTANLKKAAELLMWAKVTNNGQTCIAPDYVYVHQAVSAEFTQHCQAAVQRFLGNDDQAQADNPDYCRIVNQRHFQRVKALLDDAIDNGAHAVFGGNTDAESNYIQPTLLSAVSADMKVMQDEIFGPLLPVLPYENIEQVIAEINSRPKPLALYIYAKNKVLTNQILQETSAGGSCINHSLIQFAHSGLPFGGVNNSGIGSSHGEWGFKAFSHERAVLQDHASIVHWLAPPYTPFVRKFAKFITKHLI